MMGELVFTTGALLGRYRVIRGIARGGHAEVYEVIDPRDGRRYAAKVPLDWGEPPGEAALRLEREATLAGRIEHPNVARVLGLEYAADGRPFLLLELLFGPTLAERIARGPMAVHAAVSIAHDIARGLEASHARGVLHRDVKPGNVILSWRLGGTGVKVTDFGIAADLDASRTRSDPAPRVVGTPSYMAPEQALGRCLDGRADVYALGVVLYEMLAGAPPFAGDAQAILAQHVMRPPACLSTWRKDIPAALASLVARALEKAPFRRFPRMASMRAALADLVASLHPARPLEPPAARALSAAFEAETLDSIEVELA